ncbi:MAG: hypothetical protein D3906_13315, partial [Candidatus Electrothrix sp. AUS1_2]|nr:hypothetical protein [Candidatus Electrothrix sp. AUS1_2]
MSFAKQHGMVKNIKKFLENLLYPPQNSTASERHNRRHPEVRAAGEQNKPSSRGGSSPPKTSSTSSAASSGPSAFSGSSSGAGLEDMDQWFPSSGEKKREVAEPEKPQDKEPEAAPDDDLVAGGLYALQEREDGPYRLAKVVYIEEQVVHVVCYAEQTEQLPPDLIEQQLTVALNKEDSSFGLEHLPLPKAAFAANAVLLGQRSLSEDDLTGYRLYVDSVFDCLDEQAPDWLKKAGSYAAWRY